MVKTKFWACYWKVAVVWAAGVMAVEPMAAPDEGMGDVRRDGTVRAIEKVMPSVVNISTETVVEVRDRVGDLFREFFGPYYRRRPNAQQSLGSGVIIDKEGYVLTSYHVVQRATRVVVTLRDGREYEARPLVATRWSDVALLKIDPKEGERFRAVEFAPDDDVILGETVLALGNPFGLGESVSRGILSSKSRRPPRDGEPMELADWLQTDAAINPGNSGGPLVNLKGQMIGVNVAIYREGQGIGFAIPIRRIQEALSEMFTPEMLASRWFGARCENREGQVVIRAVEEESPAALAGLKEGDRITRLDEAKVGTVLDLNRKLIAAGEAEVSLTVERGDGEEQVSVRLIPEEEFFNAALIKRRLGADVQELTPELASAFQLNVEDGLLIAGVESEGPAAEPGLRGGDLLRAVDGQRVVRVRDVAKLLHGKGKGEEVELGVIVRRARGRFFQIYHATAVVRLR